MNPLKIVPSAQWWWLSLSAGVHDASPFLDLPLSWGGAEQDRARAKGRTWHHLVKALRQEVKLREKMGVLLAHFVCCQMPFCIAN